MKKSKVTKETQAIKHICEFCEKEFVREKSMLAHSCETKRRFEQRDLKGNVIGYNTWLEFYKKNTAGKKKREYIDFVKSAYYTAFVKFGHYCVDAHVINVGKFATYLIKNKVSVDRWATDKSYTDFIVTHLKEEDPVDAIARSIESTIELAKLDGIPTKDIFRYGNSNRICYNITKGKISPWMLYHSESGTKFLSELDETQVKMILEYIQPEQWAIRFKRHNDMLKEVKELLRAGGY